MERHPGLHSAAFTHIRWPGQPILRIFRRHADHCRLYAGDTRKISQQYDNRLDRNCDVSGPDSMDGVVVEKGGPSRKGCTIQSDVRRHDCGLTGYGRAHVYSRHEPAFAGCAARRARPSWPRSILMDALYTDRSCPVLDSAALLRITRMASWVSLAAGPHKLPRWCGRTSE